MSDILFPRVVAALKARQDDLAHGVMRQGRAEDFSKNQGLYLGLTEAIQIIEDTIKNSERS